MKTASLINKVPTNYEKTAFTDILNALFKQVDGISENKITAKHNALASAPAGTAAAYAVGDFTPDSNPTLRANTGAASFNYVRLGWVCNVPGSPGTQQEVRVLVGDVSVPGATGASLTSQTTALGGDVALNNTGTFFTTVQLTLAAGTWHVIAKATVSTSAAGSDFNLKLTDGTTIIDSGYVNTTTNSQKVATLAGTITNPAAAVALLIKDPTDTGGKALFNASGSSRDTSITAIKIV